MSTDVITPYDENDTFGGHPGCLASLMTHTTTGKFLQQPEHGPVAIGRAWDNGATRRKHTAPGPTFLEAWKAAGKPSFFWYQGALEPVA